MAVNVYNESVNQSNYEITQISAFKIRKYSSWSNMAAEECNYVF